MFTFRFYSTKTQDWVRGCRSPSPRKVIAAFDEVAGQRTIPAVIVLLDGDEVLRVGLNQRMLMKVAVWQLRMADRDRTKRQREVARERFFRHREKGVKAVKAGRNKVLRALV